MAATTLALIIAAWRTVVEASPLSLVPTVAAFTHDNQPNGTITNAYYIEDGGQVERKSMTNNLEVRVDRLTFWVTKPLNFDSDGQFTAMENLGDSIYKYLLPNARTNGWNVEADQRRITRPPNTELIVASFSFTVDYDFSSAI